MTFAACPIPRPEYPRPDFQRGQVEGQDWLNLNGSWDFKFDPGRAGLEQAWFAPGAGEWRDQIIVPFCWESLAAWGEADTAGNDNYFSRRAFLKPLEVTTENHRFVARQEVGWYRRLVRVPGHETWAGKRVVLTVGAADFFTDCWCNGVHLGRHEGGYAPFEFDLTDALGDRSQPALIVLRVEDPMDNHEQPVGKQWGWYTPTSGIWQTVYLEPRNASFIRHLRVIPDIDKSTASFEFQCVNCTDGCRIETEIVAADGRQMTLPLTVSKNAACGVTPITPLFLWDTRDPKLYSLLLRLFAPEGTMLDEVRSYFGMRKISTIPADKPEAPGALCLNNQPIYLRGALYQSYHADGVYTATSADRLRNDILFAREAGFDFLRVHIKLDDPLLLYYADTLGMLVMQDFPNFGEGGDTPLGRQRFEEMMRLGMARDFNHPSIIAWCIFNETWGFGGQSELIKWISPKNATVPIPPTLEKISNQSSFIWIHEMWLLAKSLDPSRLVEDMSVVPWEHLAAYGHVDTDVNSWHFYIDDYGRARAHIQHVIEQTYPGSKFNYIEGFTQRDVPLINSEYGGIGALDGDRDVGWSFKFLTNELRRHPELSAYIFTELTDVEWERNGFLNYDRTPKEFGYDPAIINNGDVLPINAAPITRIGRGEKIEVEVLSSHYARRCHKNVRLDWSYSGIDTLGRKHPQLLRESVKIPFPHHRVELARMVPIIAPRETMLCTLSVGAVDENGQTVARNFVQHFVSEEPPPEREDLGKRLVLRRRVDGWESAEWSHGLNAREEARNTGTCFGRGEGFFQWSFSDPALRRLDAASGLTILIEISSRREELTQTDADRWASFVQLQLNGVLAHQQLLPNHPHDSRGALSYLRGGKGAYGYLMRVVLEGPSVAAISPTAADGTLKLRCAVNQFPFGGLSVYDYDCGRFPVGPTLVIDWP